MSARPGAGSAVLSLALIAAGLTVSTAALLPHFHDRAEHGQSASCAIHQAASAMQAVAAPEPTPTDGPVFLYTLAVPRDVPASSFRVLRNGLRGPPASVPLF